MKLQLPNVWQNPNDPDDDDIDKCVSDIFITKKKLVSNEKRLELAKKSGKKVKELKESASTLKSMETFFAKAGHQGQDSQGIDDNSCG